MARIRSQSTEFGTKWVVQEGDEVLSKHDTYGEALAATQEKPEPPKPKKKRIVKKVKKRR